MTAQFTWHQTTLTIANYYRALFPTSDIQIDVDPIGQRPDIESLSKKQGIIDTVIQGYDFGEIKLRTLTENIKEQSGYALRSIDGGHRKRAIRDFIDGKFKTARNTVANINGQIINVGNKKYKELPEEVKKQFDNYSMRFTIYSKEMSDEAAGETFRRTNISTDVNHQEMLNSYEDNLVASFVREISRPIRNLDNQYHELFEYASLGEERRQVYFSTASTRLRDDEFVTRILTMVRKSETKDANYLTSSNTEMEKLFVELGQKENGEWTTTQVSNRHQKQVKSVLDFLYKFANAKKRNSKSLLTTKDVIMMIRLYFYLVHEYGRDGFNVLDFDKFYVSVRRAMNRFMSKDERTIRTDTHKDDKGVRIVSECFKQYLTVHDDQKRCIQSVKWLLEEMDINDCGLVFLDTKRVFAADEIEQVWLKQNMTDWVDGKPLKLEDAVGGHIVAHCFGGRTVIDNLAVVHKDHNRKMGSMNAEDYKQSILNKVTFEPVIDSGF